VGFLEQLRDDVACTLGVIHTLRATLPIAYRPRRIFPDLVTRLAKKYGDAPALLSERETFTYRELSACANRYAQWAHARGIRKGDVVCLMMPNRPEYMAAWLGLTQAGAVVALINTNLAGDSLAHCINAVKPKHVIVAGEFARPFYSADASLQPRPKIWSHGEGAEEYSRIDFELPMHPDTPLSSDKRPDLTLEDHALYIYTSGTTGLPKAANVSHYRLMLACCGFAAVMKTTASDRMYDCLPMYHTSGGVVATGAMLVNGGSTFIRDRFSAHEFWRDVVRHDCTLFMYIGELCRYLIHLPPDPNETKHRLRLACGNGLRPDVWGDFQRRFNIPQIVEFYAATEGNVLLFNFEGKEGAVGRLPPFFGRKYPIKLVRFDVEKEKPVRDERGLCVDCAPGEAGETIGKILNETLKPGARFEGYASEAENEKKILRNVEEEGDMWFRTGDLMRQDERGYFHFVDRVGDTFRWKGENVSTIEVSQAIAGFPGVAHSNVYGVEIPGRDGRAGMAALVTGDDFDLERFHDHLVDTLPPYARPLFVRITRSLDMTATFKQRKIDLAAEGFDVQRIKDPVYFDGFHALPFVRVDATLHRRIVSGEVRF
jgi:fatty-acyl-CoA synthase